MKLPLNWLKDYIDPQLSAQALVERLTMAGLEVEAVESLGGDTVLEIEITPNRPDLLCILGLAREVSAITSRAMKPPKIAQPKTTALKDIVQIENKNDCGRYIATIIRDAHIKEAAAEIKKRLASVGTSVINNAVDITNFVLMELGQPLHAFDYDKLAGGRVIVRRAKAGETITTLDGVERKLDPSVLVIADAKKPVAIAGIMGGIGTEITSKTRNILLESAHFDMGLVRRTSRALGLRSDSSYRFERNVNFEGVLTGANRAIDLLLKNTGGRLAGRQEISAKAPPAAGKLRIKLSEIESLLGAKVTGAQAKTWLSPLGFQIKTNADTLMVVPPAHRADISQSVDVIEEIARMTGFDRLPSALPVISASNISVDNRPRQIKDKIRKVMSACGLDEAITLSMINSRDLAKSNMAQTPPVKIFNPLSLDQELMRSSMLPSLLQVVLTNLNRGQKDLRLYEIGKRYFKDGEKESLGLVMTGRRSFDWRASKKEMIEFFDIKGVVENILNELRLAVNYDTNRMPALDPQASAAILLGDKFLGSVGKVSKSVLAQWDIKNTDVYFAGIHLDELYPLPQPQVKYRPVSGFPAIIRDVSLAVKKDVPYQKIEEICAQQGGEVLQSIEFIEQYLGDKIQPGHKGLVFSCHYQLPDRTLREEEVAEVHQRLLQRLSEDLGAIRR